MGGGEGIIVVALDEELVVVSEIAGEVLTSEEVTTGWLVPGGPLGLQWYLRL